MDYLRWWQAPSEHEVARVHARVVAERDDVVHQPVGRVDLSLVGGADAREGGTLRGGAIADKTETGASLQQQMHPADVDQRAFVFRFE